MNEQTLRRQFAGLPEHVVFLLVRSAIWWDKYPENVKGAWKTSRRNAKKTITRTVELK